jgi:gliding motility-associated-like protein
MKSSLRALAFVATVVCLFVFNPLRASHVPGGNITYQCVGPNQYLITLTLFEDCGTAFEGSGNQTLTVTNDCGFATPTTLSLTNIIYQQEVSQLCPAQLPLSECNGGALPGIWMHQWQTTVTLPGPCDSWTFAYSSCCRNTSTNVSGQPGYYWETVLNSQTAPCNNSPYVTAQPIPYVCVNQAVNYNLAITEPDGHTLAYSLIGAQSAAGTFVTYNGGYSGAVPIPGITVDPITGQINFTPTTTGTFFVVVLIEEYDSGGNLVGSVIHDIQFEVINCTNTNPTPAAGITNLTGPATLIGTNVIEVCEGSSFCFDVVFTDPNAIDVLTVTSNISVSLPGSVVTQTGTNPVTVNVCWTVPGGTGPSNPFALTAADNACPISGQATFPGIIQVIGSTTLGPDITMCAGTDTTLLAQGGSVFNWNVLSGDPIVIGTNFSCNPCANPTISPAVTTVYEVVSDLTGSCTNKDTIVVNVVPDFTYTLTQSSGTSCLLDPVQLAIVPSPAGAYTYAWSPSTGLSASNVANPTVTHTIPGTYNYSVSITSPDGCIKTNDASITVAAAYAPQIAVSASADTLICGNAVNLDVALLGGVPASCGPSIGGNCSSTTPIPVGTNNGTSSSTAEPSPYSNFYANARHQFLFTAAELQAAGFVGGKISGISWQTTAQNGAQNTFINYRISVGCTGLSTMPTSFQSGLTQVFGPQNVNIVNGVNTHNFSSSYDWDGVSNLLVEICYEWTAQYDYTYNWSVPYTNTAFNSTLYYRSDGTVACPQPTGTTLTQRPVTTFLTCPSVPDPANYTFSWTPAAGMSGVVNPTAQNTDANPQATTMYVVAVTDINGGCTTIDSVEVFTNCCDPTFQPTLTQTDVSCNGANDGELTANPIGGTGPYTYLWSTGATTQTISNLAPGSYQVAVTSDTCTIYLNATITEPAPFVFSSSTDPSCQGESTGVMDLTVSGSLGAPFQYSIDGGAAFSGAISYDSLSSGNYNIVIEDAGGCQFTAVVNVPESLPPSIDNIATTNPACTANNGAIVVTASGADGPFQYSSNGGVNFIPLNSFSNLGPSNYNIVVENIWGCQSAQSVTLTIPQPTITVAVTDPSCGLSDGSVTITAGNGTAPYQYSFDNGATFVASNTLGGFSGGSFPVIVQDAGGCTATAQVNMASNLVPTLSVTAVVDPLCPGQTGCVTVSATGGDAPYSYVYISGQPAISSNNFCGYNPGTQEVVVLGANGCSDTVQVTIATPAVVVADFTANPMSGVPPLAVDFTNASTGAVSYAWTFGDGGTSLDVDPSYTYLNDGDFVVTLIATNANGCTDTATAVIDVQGVSSIFIPNIITVNGDGANDDFRVIHQNLDTFDCTIFNRWGTAIFRFEDPNAGWDGEAHSDGTYYYVIKATGRDGQQYDLSGTVTKFSNY